MVNEGSKKCPICGKTMYVERVEKVLVDICEEHGIWLDKGELEKITHQIRLKMIIDNQAAIKKAKTQGKISGNLLGVLSFLFD